MGEIGFGELNGFVGATLGETMDVDVCLDMAGGQVVHGWC